MTDTRAEYASAHLSGKVFLYEKPELLTAEEHGELGFTPPPRPFDHVRTARAIPLTVIEFGSAQRHYPIIFSNLENPVPLAVVGVIDDINLFVDDKGQWDPLCYLPSYLRCYPFTVAMQNQDKDKMAIVVDRAAASVTENPEFPFFIDDKPTEQTEALIQFCAQYEAERKRTTEFCKKLKELDLLSFHRSTHTPDGAEEPQPLANYVSVDAAKLNELHADVVYELHKTGLLATIYLQVYSHENWRHLMARRELLNRKSPPENGP